MAQWRRSLLYKYRVLSLAPQHPHKKPGGRYAPVTSVLGGGDRMVPRACEPARLAELVNSRVSERLSEE